MTPTGNSVAIPVVGNPDHGGHRPAVEVQCGRPIPAYDTVARMGVVDEALRRIDGVEMHAPRADFALRSVISRVHDVALVDFLSCAWKDGTHPGDDVELLFADTFCHPGLHAPGTPPKRADQAGAFGQYCFDTITGVGPDTYRAAVGSVSSALTAADFVLHGAKLAVAVSRPPGHHVSTDAFGGGCYLNNAAITAQWLRDQGVDKVSIVDIDFHHGNGTQAIFYERDDVSYASLHGHPDRSYPYFTGYAEETGSGRGRGATLNLPFGAGIEGPEYIQLVEQALTAVADHDPGVVLVSLGFDTYRGDPAGDALIDTDDYVLIGRAFAQLSRPVLAILEGGYSVDDLGANVGAWVGAAAGHQTLG
ncbi:histone deacetylase family protein [Mycobacterium adipatum]|uniref:histone deacetylase family protein n=1 Tax=Mycobacterium adipatum TaxID=1682113 RepID=UPI0034E092F9